MDQPGTSIEKLDSPSKPTPTTENIKPSQDGPSAKPSQNGPSAKPSQDGPSKPSQNGPSVKPSQDGPSAKPSQDGPSAKPSQDDPSVLNPPITTGLKNVKQIIGALKDGTHEVKDILINECNIIYECKVCRNLFRCLVNLMAHKRFYCKEKNGVTLDCRADVPASENILIIEPVGVSDDEQEMSDGENKDVEVELDHEKLVPEVSFSTPKIFESKKIGSPNKFLGITRNKTFSPKDQMISLTSINSNTQAKLQILIKKDVATSNKILKPKVTKPCAVQLKKIETEVKLPLNKVPPHRRIPKENALSNRTDCDVNKLTCLKCNFKFSMYRSLYSHMSIVHATKRLHFPCPICNTTFLKIQSVKRHLMTNHKKNNQQVERLRDTIRRKAYYKKVPVASQNQASQQSKPAKKVPKSHWHKCRVCQRSFDRKTSKISHEKACLRAKAATSASCKTAKPTLSAGTKRCGQCRRIYSVFEAECICKKTSFTTTVRRPPTSRSITPSSGNLSSGVVSRPKRITNKRENKDFVDSQSLKWRSANCVESVTSSKEKAVPTERIESVGLPPAIERRLLVFMNSKRNSCLKCCRKFSSISNLRRHVATHVGWTRYQCKICSYCSFDRADVKMHIEKTHTAVPAGKVDNMVDQVHRLSSVGASGVNSPKEKDSTIRKCIGQSELVIRPTKPKPSPPMGKSLTHMIRNLTSRVMGSTVPFIKRETLEEQIANMGNEASETIIPDVQVEEEVKNECFTDLEYHMMRQNARIGTTTKPIITTLIRKDFLTQSNNNDIDRQMVNVEKNSESRSSRDSPIANSVTKVKEENSETGKFSTLVTRSGTYQKKIGVIEDI